MNVIGYDPYLSVEAAWNISKSVTKASGYDEIFEKSDFITVHVPLTPETKEMFNKESFAKMKDGVRIINLSRAGLVNTEDMKEALKSGKVARYVCDFPTDDTVGVQGIVSIPHLGASTEESEDNCAMMAVRQLIDYLENGNIKNSVNFPSVSLERGSFKRLCVLHYNVPAVLSKISSAFAEDGINIEHLSNRSKGDLAYTMADVDIKEIPESVVEKVAQIEGVIRINIKG
jgi:D-3-phosphoglycerate dehydrogenase